jgi:hypothetical protein
MEPLERYLMATKAPVSFDPETVSTLRQVLDDAWESLKKTALAERILKSAAKGERDRKRLRDAALSFAA